MAETQFKEKVHKYYREIGAFHQKISDRFSYGVLDELVAYRGRMMVIEYKTPEGMKKPSKSFKMQKYTIKMITAQGCEAYAVESLDDVRSIIERGQIWSMKQERFHPSL